jgi:hypothetical protein
MVGYISLVAAFSARVPFGTGRSSAATSHPSGLISTCPAYPSSTFLTMHGQSARIPIHGQLAQRESLLPEMFRCAPFCRLIYPLLLLAMFGLAGCGKTLRNSATEQLILSDSVDRAIRRIDFSPMAGRDCYLDTKHLKASKSATFVNADYVISSLRNQVVSAGGILKDAAADAEIVIEPRLAVLGANESEVTYGIPSSNLLTQAASLVPTAPPVPTIPEISLARKNDQMAATKLAVFAYDAKSGAPFWQSGVSTAQSNARDTWLFGIGPFQSGTIYEKPRFPRFRIKLPLVGDKGDDARQQSISHDEAYVFAQPQPPALVPPPDGEVLHASAESTDTPPAAK